MLLFVAAMQRRCRGDSLLAVALFYNLHHFFAMPRSLVMAAKFAERVTRRTTRVAAAGPGFTLLIEDTRRRSGILRYLIPGQAAVPVGAIRA